MGILDQVPFLQTGVELCVFWNCERHCTSIVWLCGTDAPEARSRTNPWDTWGTTHGAAKKCGWRREIQIQDRVGTVTTIGYAEKSH